VSRVNPIAAQWLRLVTSIGRSRAQHGYPHTGTSRVELSRSS